MHHWVSGRVVCYALPFRCCFPMEHVEFHGPAGLLEGAISRAEFTSHGAVLCHPHPLYGGSMEDAVLASVEDGLRPHQFTILRFNFRGVGASEGIHDSGSGEVEDVFAALEFLRTEEGTDEVLMGGYSFGSVMALKAAVQAPPQALLLVAPPLSMAAGLAVDELRCPVQLILGEHDDFVDVSEASAAFPTARVHVVQGADHFFFGSGPEIAEVVHEFIEI